MSEQSMNALALAQAQRARSAEIHRSLAAGATTMASHITDSALRNIRVRRTLGWQRRWGPDRVAQAMAQIGGYNPTCGQLTPRQIAVLVRVCASPREGS